MSDRSAPSAPTTSAGSPPQPRATSLLAALEIDPRFLGMVGALIIIWIGFHLLSGTFMTPRNLWNLSVQTASISVMATGMVLVIVTRNIDLSVGSILGLTGMVMAVFQASTLTPALGFNHPLVWILTLASGIVLGVAIGGFQGLLIAYLKIPAFIVTLGGLLVWRGAAWWVARGAPIPLTDDNFKLMGGGATGAVGATWSWVVAVIAIAVVVIAAWHARRQRIRFRFPVKPMWAEITTIGIVAAVIVGATTVMNAYTLPPALAKRYAEANGLPMPADGAPLVIAFGYAVPVLIAVAVGIVMTFITNRTRFGRYVFAIGGNPEAAELAGINTRRVTVSVFALMGGLAALSAAISAARLTSATNSLGTLDELYTIAGAMLGALVMQSLQSGMVLLGLDTPLQNIVVGIVLVVAVWLDTVYRARIH
jgi:D-xylose transport system permease protein